MSIRRKPKSSTFIVEPYKNRDKANALYTDQREQQLPFIFGVIGKPSLRHAPTKD